MKLMIKTVIFATCLGCVVAVPSQARAGTPTAHYGHSKSRMPNASANILKLTPITGIRIIVLMRV